MKTQNYQLQKLDNGLQVAHIHVKNTQLVHCGFIINCGSQNDRENPGMAHALEHMIFKGTNNRNNRQILGYIDNVGGEINAYTTRDYTAVYCTVHKRFAARAIHLLSDIVSNSIFPQDELEKEKKVIIEEIKMYLDSPEDNIADEFFEKFLTTHPLAHNILGTKASVNKISQKEMITFYKNYYHAGNMVFSVVGNISNQKVLQCLRKEKLNPAIETPWLDTTAIKPTLFTEKVKQKNSQAHVMLGMLAPSFNAENTWTMAVINNLLGGYSMNNRLNMSIREKHGLAYHVESNYQRFANLGVFTIYIGCHAQHADTSLQLAVKEMQKLANTPLGKNQLSIAKNQIIGQIAIAEENYSAIMLSLGKSIMNYGHMLSLPQVLEKINNITAADVQNLSAQLFDSKNIATLMYVPK